MGYVGVSLIVASVVWVIVAPPTWIHPYLPPFLLSAHGLPVALPERPIHSSGKIISDKKIPESEVSVRTAREDEKPAEDTNGGPRIMVVEEDTSASSERDASPIPDIKAAQDRAAMPPPPPIFQTPKVTPLEQTTPQVAEPEEEQAVTPKASAALNPTPVPSFSLSGDDNKEQAGQPSPKAPAPAPFSLSSMMPPPPPSTSRAAPPRSSFPMANSPQVARAPGAAPPRLQSLPTASAFPAPNSQQIARGPAPNRGLPGGGLRPPPGPGARGGGGGGGGGLAPPPTHSQPPQKPSRKVLLTPGHSPLDWARISGPTSDLRNVPPDTPYLKVSPSMLKKQNGRRGTDAWCALGGRVYNISPYADYHPGGRGELLRGAGKDGTRLFGEVHPWVNYETMLSACLVGVLVSEEEATKTSEMDMMD